MPRKILFASCHGYIDPANRAAKANRDLLNLLGSPGVIVEDDNQYPHEVCVRGLTRGSSIDYKFHSSTAEDGVIQPLPS